MSHGPTSLLVSTSRRTKRCARASTRNLCDECDDDVLVLHDGMAGSSVIFVVGCCLFNTILKTYFTYYRIKLVFYSQNYRPIDDTLLIIVLTLSVTTTKDVFSFSQRIFKNGPVCLLWTCLYSTLARVVVEKTCELFLLGVHFGGAGVGAEHS